MKEPLKLHLDNLLQEKVILKYLLLEGILLDFSGNLINVNLYFLFTINHLIQKIKMPNGEIKEFKSDLPEELKLCLPK